MFIKLPEKSISGHIGPLKNNPILVTAQNMQDAAKIGGIDAACVKNIAHKLLELTSQVALRLQQFVCSTVFSAISAWGGRW